MMTLGSNAKVYLATGPTDMRKAINGLMVLVEDVLQADPFSSNLFVFCNGVIGTFVQKLPLSKV